MIWTLAIAAAIVIVVALFLFLAGFIEDMASLRHHDSGPVDVEKREYEEHLRRVQRLNVRPKE